jgi:hypothetical protein
MPDFSYVLEMGVSTEQYLRAETFLKTLIIVSDAKITDEGSLGTSSFAWSYVSSMDIPGMFYVSESCFWYSFALFLLRRLGLRASDSRWTCIFEQVSTVLDVYS